MTDKDLNIKYICERTLLGKDNKLVPIILDMIQESYKAGLSQAEYDNTMELMEENQELKEIINKAIDFIETCNPNAELHSKFLDESYLSNYGAEELLDILKGVS